MSESGSPVLTRASVFCLIPPELADELLEPLREHFADEPSVTVVVERRIRQRRSGVDRRTLSVPSPEVERKRSGRERRERADRRSPQIPRQLRLPESAQKHAERIRFAQRLPAVGLGDVQALSLEALIDRIQAGDPEASTEFYWRMFEKVYSRLRTILGRYSRPDEHMTGMFGTLFDRMGEWLPGGERAFDDWFYEVIDSHAATLPRDPVPDVPQFRY